MKITKQELLDGLATLDPKSDELWTEEGLPALDAVQAALMDDTITREDLAENANGFTRAVAAQGLADRADTESKTKDALVKASKLSQIAPKDDPVLAEASDVERRRAELQADIDAVRAKLAEHDQLLDDAKKSRETLVKAVDEAVKAFEKEFPPLKAAHAIQSWLASEAEKRAQRAAAAAANSYVSGKSPIDQSMARRTGHGHGRKAVPLMAQG